MTTGCLRIGSITAASGRVTTSERPPGGNALTIVTGRVGYGSPARGAGAGGPSGGGGARGRERVDDRDRPGRVRLVGAGCGRGEHEREREHRELADHLRLHGP